MRLYEARRGARDQPGGPGREQFSGTHEGSEHQGAAAWSRNVAGGESGCFDFPFAFTLANAVQCASSSFSVS